MILVDTSVWSFGLRRKPETRSAKENALVQQLEDTIQTGLLTMIGPIRQELLSGIRTEAQINKIATAMQSFPDEPLVTEDYETAARFANVCKSKGVAASSIDLIICAAAFRRKWSIFTTDQDFVSYARVLGVVLLKV